MTDAAALLTRLFDDGCILWADKGKLEITSPVELTPELLATLRAEKPALLEALGDPDFQAAEVSRRLSAKGPGWAAVRSQVLSETVIFLRDEAVTIPKAAAGLVTYT